MRHVFIIGSKGIPANYGGFETFVDRLTEGQQNEEIRYHIACMDDHEERVEYHGADCFHLAVPAIGPAKAVYYDLKAFSWCLKEIAKEQYEAPIVYVLACRIGPFVGRLKRKLTSLGGTLLINPDGHEWKRAKWNAAIRKYWKYSEKLMVKHAGLLVCDSKNIESYIQNDYRQFHPKTTFIAYGADLQTEISEDATSRYEEWLKEHQTLVGNYALVVGRFVPENNYETMIREYMRSGTDKKLLLITNVEQNEFYEKLKRDTEFDKDDRICFAGTVYDKELLTLIRQNAWVYLHGHEVGGTNPSLLEALGTTAVNLLYDVGFNREVGEDSAYYWNREQGSLSGLLNDMDVLGAEERDELGEKAKRRIRQAYSWPFIVSEYEKLFLTIGAES